MNPDHGSYLSWFDWNVNKPGIVIGRQFNLIVVRFGTAPKFTTMNHELTDSGSDWAAEHVTAGCVSNDITFMTILLFSETIGSRSDSLKFCIRTEFIVKTTEANIETNVFESKSLIISCSSSIFTRT